MIIVGILQTILMTVLTGYLALSNGLADKILEITGAQDIPIYTETSDAQQETIAVVQLPDVEPTYEYGGAIPRILLENSDYQQAALGAGLLSEPTELFEVEKSQVEKITESLVNIYCQYTTSKYKRTTTGTGFFIHQSGVILTNAHVAQFLLLEDTQQVTNAQCVIRMGNPALPTYEAKLLYLSPAWIRTNAHLIEDENPSGTGERDYALLYISKSIENTELPPNYQSLPIDTNLLPRNTSGDIVFAGGYPAEKLYTEGAETNLIPSVASTTVGELYTFGSNYADIFSIKESPVGEQGSSGGPIMREGGGVIGLIVTKGNETIEGPRSLRGLTLSYIDRTITEETGFTLEENMRGDLTYRGEIFKKALAPFLSRLLEFELE